MGLPVRKGKAIPGETRIPFFAEAGPLYVDYERFVLQRLMIAKVRQYNGDGSAGMLLKELRKEARRNGIGISSIPKMEEIEEGLFDSY